jgi:xylulokinase
MSERETIPNILALDLGTSYLKACLFDGQGQLLALHRAGMPVRRPRPGWAEMDADAFRRTVTDSVAAVRGQCPAAFAEVGAVSFASQTNSFVLLGEADRPRTPIILWSDLRAAPTNGDFRRRWDVPGFAGVTGVSELTAEFMPAKLAWLQRHSPRAWRDARRICLISDYLTLWLTGRHVSEAGAAALTGLVDIDAAAWWPEMLERFGIDSSLLPNILRAGSDLGPLSPSAAEQLGLGERCRFIVGCLDQYAGAIGAATARPGRICETTGTVLAVVACGEGLRPAPPAGGFQGPAFRDGLFFRMALGSRSANYLEWYRSLQPDAPSFEHLIAEAERAIHGGELALRDGVSPHEAPRNLEEVFRGIQPHHTRGDFVRCIMQAVAESLRECVETLCAGDMPPEVRSAGGAARSELWLQLKAKALGCAVTATRCPEPTSLGAAALAAAAMSGQDVRDLADEWVRPGPIHQPR